MFSKSNITMWLSRREEKRVLDQCKIHLNKIFETVSGMRDVVISFCEKDSKTIEENYKKTFDSEREADEVKHKILQEVSTGPLHPIDREEVIRLVLTGDDIAENAKSAAGKLRFASTDCLTNETKNNLKEMASKCVEIVDKVRIAFESLGKGTNEAIEATNQVERLEENIDEFRLNLIKNIMKCGEDVKSIGSWLMLINAIENMEDVSDRSEDVADVIRTIAILG